MGFRGFKVKASGGGGVWGLGFRVYGPNTRAKPTPGLKLKRHTLIWGPILLRVLYRNPH